MVERRLFALTWNYTRHGHPFDRKDRHIVTVMAGIHNTHAAPPRQKEAALPEDLLAILETLEHTAHGLLFRRVTGQGKAVEANRLNDQEAARFTKQTALAAGVPGDLPEGKPSMMFAGHSLRAGLASSAEVDECYVQKQFGYVSAEMTRKYQRRHDRFCVNLTKASGLQKAPPLPVETVKSIRNPTET